MCGETRWTKLHARFCVISLVQRRATCAVENLSDIKEHTLRNSDTSTDLTALQYETTCNLRITGVS